MQVQQTPWRSCTTQYVSETLLYTSMNTMFTKLNSGHISLPITMNAIINSEQSKETLHPSQTVVTLKTPATEQHN